MIKNIERVPLLVFNMILVLTFGVVKLQAASQRVSLLQEEAACRSITTFANFYADMAAGRYSNLLPQKPECIDIPAKTELETDGATETVKFFGKDKSYLRIKYAGSWYWVSKAEILSQK